MGAQQDMQICSWTRYLLLVVAEMRKSWVRLGAQSGRVSRII